MIKKKKQRKKEVKFKNMAKRKKNLVRKGK
jgi:hypothetical protein